MRKAQKLHSQMLEFGVDASEKSRLAREISGLLFTAEATALNITNRARIICLRIKTHAHLTAMGEQTERPLGLLWGEYRELESLLDGALICEVFEPGAANRRE